MGLWKQFKHDVFKEHDWIQIAEGDTKSGGLLFGGAVHWTRYKCTICYELSSLATESFKVN